MNAQRRRIGVSILAALIAGYLGARLTAPEPSGLALAAAGSEVNSDGKVLVATTGAGGRDANRLVVVDTVVKHIMVYGIYERCTRLIAARTYDVDLEWGNTPDVPGGNGFSYAEARAGALEVRKAREKLRRRWRLRGREMVVTCDSPQDESENRIVLVNPELKCLLVYRLNGNSIWLVSARTYDYDERLLYTKKLKGSGLTVQEVIRQVDEADRRAAARP
jgi:hypothetical protein